ncbi:MAG TPA: hypothetical protein VIV40_39510 [Kofleriaceae bacterium]
MTTTFVATLAIAFAAPARAETDPLAALLARTDAIARQVAKQRGLPLKKKVEQEVVDRDELRARLLKLAAEQKTQSETRAEGLALARWGMIPLDTDYLQLMVDLLTDQIAGYYDPDTKKLTISKSAGADPEWAEMVLAHELDHALQDQTYDLDKFEDLPDSEGDAALARQALVEGDGVALMIELMLARKKLDPPWHDPTVARELSVAMALPSGDLLDKAPLAVREALLFPYRGGFTFVAALRHKQPWSAVDGAFKRPPRSTEQILHPDKYKADEKPIVVDIKVPAALADYHIAHSSVWGELGFSLFVRSGGLDDRGGTLAGDGWGGDRVITLTKGDDTRPEHAIGIARFEWDSEADAFEAHEAAVRALDTAIVGGTAEHTETRTRWLALDGTATVAERRGTSTVIAHGVPVRLLDAVQGELWTISSIAEAKK